MKAITLYEPWASLMAIGAKVNETRPMRTNHRGDICIHAAMNKAGASDYTCGLAYEAMERRGIKPALHWGCIVAVVEFWDVQPSENFLCEGGETATLSPGNRIVISSEEFSFGNYQSGRWIYRTRNLRRLKVPVKASGLQCVGWTVQADIEGKVNEQLQALKNV